MAPISEMDDQSVPTDDFLSIEQIANSVGERPVFMIAINRYFEGE